MRTVVGAVAPPFCDEGDPDFPASNSILIGTRCVVLVKFPEALLGGMRENSDAAAAPIRATVPWP